LDKQSNYRWNIPGRCHVPLIVTKLAINLTHEEKFVTHLHNLKERGYGTVAKYVPLRFSWIGKYYQNNTALLRSLSYLFISDKDSCLNEEFCKCIELNYNFLKDTGNSLAWYIAKYAGVTDASLTTADAYLTDLGVEEHCERPNTKASVLPAGYKRVYWKGFSGVITRLIEKIGLSGGNIFCRDLEIVNKPTPFCMLRDNYKWQRPLNYWPKLYDQTAPITQRSGYIDFLFAHQLRSLL